MTRSAAKRATIRRMTNPEERDQVEHEGFVGLSEISDADWNAMREESEAEYARFDQIGEDEQYTQVHESFSELAEADNDEEGY